MMEFGQTPDNCLLMPKRSFAEFSFNQDNLSNTLNISRALKFILKYPEYERSSHVPE